MVKINSNPAKFLMKIKSKFAVKLPEQRAYGQDALSDERE